MYDLTGADWAKEHLDYGLPSLDEVSQFAAKHNYHCQIWPNGSLTTSVAMVFVDYYAMLAGHDSDLTKIHHLYNTCFFDQLTDARLPNAHLVELDVSQKVD